MAEHPYSPNASHSTTNDAPSPYERSMVTFHHNTGYTRPQCPNPDITKPVSAHETCAGKRGGYPQGYLGRGWGLRTGGVDIKDPRQKKCDRETRPPLEKSRGFGGFARPKGSPKWFLS